MKIAIVYDYLYTYGGGERVLELFHEIFSDADIYTLLYVPSRLPPEYMEWGVKTSWLNKIPFKRRFIKYMTPCMPLAIESFDLSDYDLVLSISAGFAKGVITSIHTCHIGYTLTVPRFLWGYETSTQVRHKKNIFLPFINNYLRIWDKAASDRVDAFLANSETVKERIAKAYGREATVIYSPVDEQLFSLSTIQREDYYLIVSRLEAYKRIDLAIEACKSTGSKLYIIGEGPIRASLEKQSIGADIQFLGKVDDDTVIRHYKSAKAVIFPGADDLGLVPIEAQMCGTPVIALKKDGAIETVKDGISGVLFQEQTVASLENAMAKLEGLHLNPEVIRSSVSRFAKGTIAKQLKEIVDDTYASYKKIYT